MIFRLMSVNLSCGDIAMAQYLGHGAGIDTIHLHQAIESMAEIVNAGKIVETASVSHFYQSLPQPIIVQLMV